MAFTNGNVLFARQGFGETVVFVVEGDAQSHKKTMV